jgi:transcriptional regulator GlxA family with amidase domain
MARSVIGLFLFDNAEELDFVGPYEVFTMANEAAAHFGRAEPNEVLLISETGADVRCAKGMRVGAANSMKQAPSLDVLCVPGGDGTRALLNNRPVLDWIASTAAGCTWVTSVCTGSFVLAAAGLTEGRRITTHWGAIEEFGELGLKGEVRSNVRYVRDGNLVTAAGVSAGIDMALWLTGQMHGVDLARATQKAMEYDPAPPYSADV